MGEVHQAQLSGGYATLPEGCVFQTSVLKLPLCVFVNQAMFWIRYEAR